MARYYGLPVEASGGGTSQFSPNIQASYERALNSVLPVLSWPDILVGPGLMGGSTHFSPEQLLIDIEVYRMGMRAHQGISAGEDFWLDDVISKVGPAGHFMAQPSTIKNMRSGEWYLTDFGWHGSFEEWKRAGKPNLIQEANQKVADLLTSHEPLPFPEEVEQELEQIYIRAKEDQENL
jgi:trimethylamine--corrinoid protein Co-methyltransferase